MYISYIILVLYYEIFMETGINQNGLCPSKAVILLLIGNGLLYLFDKNIETVIVTVGH